MAQLKAQNINWLDEAWRVSSVIAEMPDTPPGLLSTLLKWPPLQGSTKQHIRLLQDGIALHLAYRSKVVHKISVESSDGEKLLISPQSSNPVATAKTLAFLRKIGVKLQPVDLWAYDAHMKLGRILLDRYVCKEWKRILPLVVASIGGNYSSETATLKAIQPRNRPTNELREGKANALSKNPFSNWKELLNHLQGDEIVIEWDEKLIRWNDSEGRYKKTATGTFKNW